MVTSASITNRDVAATFASYPEDLQVPLLALRKLILDTADTTEGVGAIDEVLKWGQPSYVTGRTKSGSTIRVAPTGEKSDQDYAMYFICSTTLVDDFKELFGDAFTYEGTRALAFKIGDNIPEDELQVCVGMALTYHLRKAR